MSQQPPQYGYAPPQGAPQGYVPPQGYGYAPPPPQRSAIPKVIGILMIIFGSLGLLGGLIGLAGSGFGQIGMREIPELSKLDTIQKVTNVLGLLMAGFQLYVGVRCVGYKTNAPSLARVYGIIALVNVVAGMVIALAIINPIVERTPILRGMGGLLGGMTIFFSLFAAAWAVIILVLMGKQSAKDACSAQL